MCRGLDSFFALQARCGFPLLTCFVPQRRSLIMYSSVDGEDDDTVETIDMHSGGGMNYLGSNRFGGIGQGGGLFPGGGNMDRRPSLGAGQNLDAVVADMLGRRPSLGGSNYENNNGMMPRQDSLESTAAVLDACILDLTRRRRGMGGLPSAPSSFPSEIIYSSFGQHDSNCGLQAALSARQQQLKMQQIELENRQRELEMQRQQLISGLQDPALQQTLAGIPIRQPSVMGSMGGGAFGDPPPYGQQLYSHMNDNMPPPYEDEAMPPMDDELMPPNQSQQWWVCQICNSKAFASRGEAMDHEAICDAVTSQQAQMMANRLEMQDFQPQEQVPINPETFGMITRPLCLAMPTDKDWLTPLHCFVRRHCVEVFTAGPDDVAHPAKGKRKPIQVGQVGIRCPFCHVTGDSNNRERGSVYYPTTVASIYNATMNLLQRHLHSCPSVPDQIMEQYHTLKGDDARSGTSKKYWMESAQSLGLVDTPGGIRYSNLPPPPLPHLSDQQQSTSGKNDMFSSKSNAAPNSPPKDGEEGAEKIQSGLSPSEPLVQPEDKPYATRFSYELLNQMQPCVFTEADRLGKRKGLPAGFAGLACKHCFGGYGSGRFFPSSIKTLSDTSKTLNVLHNHMMKCRKCPVEVRDTLEKYRVHHDDERSKKKFGSQKAFFARIWNRLHGGNSPSKSLGVKRKMQQGGFASSAPGPTTKQDHMFSGGAFAIPLEGMGGLDVLSMQAASAASGWSPSKRRED